MNKFYEWLLEKDYGHYCAPDKDGLGLLVIYDKHKSGTVATNQALIGYMIEYLIENKKGGSLVIGLCLDVNEVYRELKNEIERS